MADRVEDHQGEIHHPRDRPGPDLVKELVGRPCGRCGRPLQEHRAFRIMTWSGNLGRQTDPLPLSEVVGRQLTLGECRLPSW